MPVIVKTIREGIPNTGMRAFGRAKGGALTDAQIDTIAQHLRSTSAPK